MLKITEDFLVNNYKISDRALEIYRQALSDIEKDLQSYDDVREFNQLKVLKAFQEERISDSHFTNTTGYGLDDIGRDALDRVYARIFKTEAALVRHNFVSGTHAIGAAILRNVNQERRDSLKDGQNPYAVIVSCSDSRVTPTTVFNAGLGEIFDVRLAGNVVDDDALGSIEYAVEHLNTPLVVVMGHQSCGAVTATYNEVVKGEKVTGNMESFVEKITPIL